MRLENVESFYPLSPLQEGLLFHSLADPTSRMYFNQTAVTLRGELDVAAFERAWQQVVDHHPILRTFFVWENLDAAIQVVERRAWMPFHTEDWTGVPAGERRRRFDALRRDDLERGFDLSEPPLMRLTLIRTADETWDLLWSFHHILMDGWSMFLVLKQVFASYEAFGEGRELILEPSRPYRDHLVWLQQQSSSEAETFWRKKLVGFTTPTPLLADHPPEAREDPGDAFETESLQLATETTEALRAFARRHRLTLNTVLQGTWAVLLSRCAGEEDVLYGVVMSGRPAALAGVESMVGLFINTLPARTRVFARTPVREWLRRMQTEQAELRQFERSRLVDVHGWSEVPRGVPLFESIFLFENYHRELPLEAMSRSLEIRNVRWFERFNYPLAALAVPGPQLLLRLIYRRQRFERPTIERMLGNWRTLIEGLLADADQRLGDLPLVNPVERRRLLVEWNDSQTDYPRDRSIHELFEEQVERIPDAVALVHEGRRLTYRDLNERSNRVAHRLQRLGVGPEVRVGLCMERSLEMVPALLGILKAGGAYVSLDPDYPRDRLEFMLADAQTPVLLTQTRLAAALPHSAARALCLDADPETLSRESRENPHSGVRPENLAYVSFTSGSTGRPKGTCVPHRAVVRLVKNTNFADLSPEHVLLQFAPVSFDASTFEIWGSLLNGARLVVAPAGALSLTELGDVIQSQGVTTLWLTAGLFHQMVENHSAGLNGVRQLLAGGDVLSVSHVRTALDELDGCTLINGYGPTENTTFTCCHPMTDPEAIGGSVPIGRPVANTTVYLLDPELQPVPVGVAGDLFAGGDGLAREYLHQPGLTAERFIPDPFGGVPGARLYKTGDQARYLADGTIEFLGRNDFQVKIRGFRIELGEIESVLKAHPAVRDAVVLAHEDVPGEKRLLAYFVPSLDSTPAGPDLREFLRQTLPEYMVPAAYLPMDSFPLTSNGKVDWRALPAPDGVRPEFDTAYVAPRAELERTIAQIWQEMLHVDRIGVHDNFFDLGGHSLDLMRVHSRIKALNAREVSMVDMFQLPTVSALAKYLADGGAGAVPTANPEDAERKRREGRDRLKLLRQRRRPEYT